MVHIVYSLLLLLLLLLPLLPEVEKGVAAAVPPVQVAGQPLPPAQRQPACRAATRHACQSANWLPGGAGCSAEGSCARGRHAGTHAQHGKRFPRLASAPTCHPAGGGVQGCGGGVQRCCVQQHGGQPGGLPVDDNAVERARHLANCRVPSRRGRCQQVSKRARWRRRGPVQAAVQQHRTVQNALWRAP